MTINFTDLELVVKNYSREVAGFPDEIHNKLLNSVLEVSGQAAKSFESPGYNGSAVVSIPLEILRQRVDNWKEYKILGMLEDLYVEDGKLVVCFSGAALAYIGLLVNPLNVP